MVRVLLSLISLVSIKTEAITYRHTNGRQDIRACFRSTRLFLDFSSTGVKIAKELERLWVLTLTWKLLLQDRAMRRWRRRRLLCS